MSHRCHALRCSTQCPSAHLMCGAHWAMVPKDLQTEVYATVRMRGSRVDASWAPWWRAQAKAILFVAKKEREPALLAMSPEQQLEEERKASDWLRREMEFAARLEKRGVP
jgi:hypothetical protein